MDVITALQFKGGAGKTVTTMALASAAAARGQRVVLIDCDQNTPMTRWHRVGLETGYWEDAMTVERHMAFEALAEAVDAHEASGAIDLILVDARGGRSDFLNGLAQLADAVLIPSRPVKVDVDGAADTFSYLHALGEAGAHVAPARLVFAALKPEKQQTVTMRAFVEAMRRFPCLGPALRERSAFTNMQAMGLLSEIARQKAADTGALERGQARIYAEALSEAGALLDATHGLAAAAREAA